MVDQYSGYSIFGSRSHGEMEWVTYAEFADLVIPFAHGLVKSDVSVGDHVAVLTEDSTWFALGQWALAHHGATMVPISAAETAQVVGQVIRSLGVRTLLCSKQSFAKVSESIRSDSGLAHVIVLCHSPDVLQAEIECFSRDTGVSVAMLPRVIELGRTAGEMQFPEVSPQSVAVINFSAGTAGVRKPSAYSHANVIAAAVGLSSSGYVFEQGVYFSSISLCNPLERSIQLLVLAHGGSIGLVKEVGAIEAMQLIKPTIVALPAGELLGLAEEIVFQARTANCFKRLMYDLAFSVSAHLRRDDSKTPWFFEEIIIKEFQMKFGGRVRLMISALSFAQPRVLAMLRTMLQIPVIQIYGTAETGGVIAIQDVSDREVSVVGPPAVTCEVRIRGLKQGSKRASTEAGEIMVRGPSVFTGYHANHHMGQAVLSDSGWFATGDLGKITESGTIELTDTILNIQRRARGS
jgi:long-chain acyl-CoA synthetase